MVTKESVIESIRSSSPKILPGVAIDQIEVRRQKQLGFHIGDSQRFICRVRGSGNDDVVRERAVFVKNRGNVDKEYQNMEMLWSQHYFREQKYVIPQPLLLVSDGQNSLLFLEYFSGQSFLTLYYRARLFQKKTSTFLEEMASTVARWLADFQSIYRSQQKQPIPSVMLDYRRSLDAFGMLERRHKRMIAQKMDAMVRDCPLYFYDTYVHDQFLFRNIIFSEGKMCVVDFPYLWKGWPLYDFFTFLIGIDRLAQYPIFSDSACEIMKNCFISEYALSGGVEYDRKVFEDLWALFVVANLRRRYRRHSGVRGLLNDRFVNQTSKRLVAWSKR